MWRKFLAEEAGLETVEYAVMTALIVLAIVAAVSIMLAAIIGEFSTVSSHMNGIGT
jgi:Flp pilus assembly pilin Flp